MEMGNYGDSRGDSDGRHAKRRPPKVAKKASQPALGCKVDEPAALSAHGSEEIPGARALYPVDPSARSLVRSWVKRHFMPFDVSEWKGSAIPVFPRKHAQFISAKTNRLAPEPCLTGFPQREAYKANAVPWRWIRFG